VIKFGTVADDGNGPPLSEDWGLFDGMRVTTYLPHKCMTDGSLEGHRPLPDRRGSPSRISSNFFVDDEDGEPAYARRRRSQRR
jgi:hypothetical protein